MSFPWVAFTAAVILSCEFASAQSPRVLTLDSAFARALEKNPELARLDPVREGARAALDAESQSPPLRLELELENAPRSDQDSSFDSAETTLSLASVFERGGKREARAAAADAQLHAVELQGEQRRADLLAEVARRYLDVVAAQSMAELVDAEIKQRQEVLDATAQRVRAGATPDSVRLSAEAALARATLQRERLQSQVAAAALRLSLLWRSRAADFERASGDLLTIPATPTLASLRDLVERSPELRRFADESRLREARLQLARSARATDIDWRAGVRRLEEDGSWAAVVGISVPIGSSSRAEPRMRAAQADLVALTFEREAEELSLEATLVEAHMRLSAASAEVTAARDILLPKFAQAERASERAFRAGALSYTEWAQLQSEQMTARREQLLAAVEAHRALIEIQRLTGSPFVTRNQP